MERIFIATLGMAPAVVTETLWALRQRVPPWIPDRIEVITTRQGARAVRDRLMVGAGPLASLYPPPRRIPPMTVLVPVNDMAAPRVRRTALHWDPATGRIGTEGDEAEGIADVDDAQAAACMGDLILDRVAAACALPDNQLHLSISGGRKTMSAHALFSLGLVGNPQDEASHVLMGAAFDTNPQFWHPDQGGRIHTVEAQRAAQSAGTARKGLPAPALDPREAAASLRLFPIAAPRYDIISRSDRGALPRLSAIIDQMNLAGAWLRAPAMRLDTRRNTVTINGETRPLDPMDFVWLRLLATAADEGWTSAEDRDQPAGMVTAARLLYGRPGYGRLADLRLWYQEAMTAGLRGDEVARRAAQRTELLGADDPRAASRNLGARVTGWLAEISQGAARGDRVRRAAEEKAAEDLVAVIGSFSKLREELAAAFGKPLVEAMLPRARTKYSKVDGMPRAGWMLAGARPGFLSWKDG